jgi:histidinol dehydrogenase
MRRYGSVVVCLASALAFTASLYAADMQIGTWKLNLAKSKYNPAALALRSATVKGEAVDNGIKNVVDTVDSQGKSFHYEYTAKYDGKDYPVKGDPNRDTTALKKIDDNTFEQINKKSGKITTTNRWVYARDGKSRTQTTTGADAQGQKVNNVVVWDKQ